MNHKKTCLLAAALLLAVGLADAAQRALPVAVAESESFEAVGRLEDEGFSWYIDRADSNAPVLGARLEVEANGRAVQAVFRPEQGDYLIADSAWLAPLRQPGEHMLALTVMAGEESDLLSAELHVDAGAKEPAPAALATPVGMAGGAAVLAGLFWLGRRKMKGGRA